MKEKASDVKTGVGFWKSGFRVLIFKNPGNRVRVRVSKNVLNWRFLTENIAKLALFCKEDVQIGT